MSKHMRELGLALETHRARRIPGDHLMRACGVAAVLAEAETGLEVLLIRRASRRGDPWSGHVSFPGGVRQAGDVNTLATARRETREEIGLALGADACAGRLSQLLTVAHGRLRPMVITPYVFFVSGRPALQAGDEVAEVFWMPLSFLADPGNQERLRWRLLGMNWQMRCYRFDGHPVWGLTLMMLRELLSLSGARLPT